MGDVRDFSVVNSFTSQPFAGNPAAVFVSADGLDKVTMQMTARQFNLVETAFVKKDDECDFTILYFTPLQELPVAGHPTIAAVIALADFGMIDLAKKDLLIKTGAGKQRVFIDNSHGLTVHMKQPNPEFLAVVNDRKVVSGVLGIEEADLCSDLPIQAVNTGLGHLIVPIKNLEALMKLKRNIIRLKQLCEKFGVREIQAFTFDTFNGENDLHTRNICPREGIEDPACGIGNGALGAYLAMHYYKSSCRIKAEQGTIVNMPSSIDIIVSVNEDKLEVSIGGTGKVMMRGRLFL